MVRFGNLMIVVLLVTPKWSRAQNNSCGVPNGILRSLWIHGGTPVDKHSWPWVASVRRTATTNHFCTGTLISNRFVLTAAHCFPRINNEEPNPSLLFVAFGCHQISIRNEKESWVAVKKVHIHPYYQQPNVYKMSYDLALLELMNEPENPDVIRPICLPTLNSFLQSGEECAVLGWGKTEVYAYSDILLQANLPVMSLADCRGNEIWADYVDNTMICAGDNGNSRSGPCQGDSGAPLLCKKVGSQWSVYGVVSWGSFSCGERPGIFTNVAFMMDWILKILQAAVSGDKIEFAKPAGSSDMHISNKQTKPPNAIHYTSNIFESLINESNPSNYC